MVLFPCDNVKILFYVGGVLSSISTLCSLKSEGKYDFMFDNIEQTLEIISLKAVNEIPSIYIVILI